MELHVNNHPVLKQKGIINQSFEGVGTYFDHAGPSTLVYLIHRQQPCTSYSVLEYKLTCGTSSQSSASFMAWLAFCWAFLGSMMECSGQRPGARASTRAAMRVPSFQSDVRLFTSRSGIWSCVWRRKKGGREREEVRSTRCFYPAVTTWGTLWWVCACVCSESMLALPHTQITWNHSILVLQWCGSVCSSQPLSTCKQTFHEPTISSFQTFWPLLWFKTNWISTAILAMDYYWMGAYAIQGFA